MTADQSNLWNVKILFSFFFALRVTTDRQHDLKIVPFLTTASMRRNQRPLSFVSTRVEAAKRTAHERGFMQRKSKTLVSCWKGKYDRAYFLKRCWPLKLCFDGWSWSLVLNTIKRLSADVFLLLTKCRTWSVFFTWRNVLRRYKFGVARVDINT